MAETTRARRLAGHEPPKTPGWLRQYLTLQRAAWKTSFIYRGNLVLLVLASVALQGTQLLFIGVLLGRFGVIAGWSTAQIAFLYGLRLTAHGVATSFFGQHQSADTIVREGTFDRFLLRPASPLMQLFTYRFNLGSLGDLLLGLGILLTAVGLAPINWSPVLVLLTVAAAIGGGLVEAGVQIGLSGLTFRLHSTYNLKITVDNTFTDFGAYPMKIFGTAGALALTFALPLAFIAYLPATIILDRTADLVVPVWLAASAPGAGPLLLVAGALFFLRQSRHYASPGA